MDTCLPTYVGSSRPSRGDLPSVHLPSGCHSERGPRPACRCNETISWCPELYCARCLSLVFFFSFYLPETQCSFDVIFQACGLVAPVNHQFILGYRTPSFAIYIKIFDKLHVCLHSGLRCSQRPGNCFCLWSVKGPCWDISSIWGEQSVPM